MFSIVGQHLVALLRSAVGCPSSIYCGAIRNKLLSTNSGTHTIIFRRHT
jgi:hypothetical protein